MTRTIGILNSGGDCAGLNTVIASLVKTGTPLGFRFLGFEVGWEGILDPVMYQELTPERVRGISHLGGTILRTANKGRFAGRKGGAGTLNEIDPEILDMAERNLKKLGVEGLIVIGGDGTLSAAMQLSARGVQIVGVPKTMDNDLVTTDQTFGFSSAVDMATAAIDALHTTAASHDRVMIIECMGRHAGWVTLHAGLAGGADAILLPEFGCDVNALIAHLRNQRARGRGSSIIAIGEGVNLVHPDHAESEAEMKQEVRLGGVSSHLMRLLEQHAPNEFEIRTVVLGHVQRGGNPNPEDRLLAKQYAVAAIHAYANGQFGQMVTLRDGKIGLAPIEQAGDGLHLVTKHSSLYKTAEALRVFLGH